MSSSRAAELDRLLAEQAGEWPLLAKGLEGLRAARTRAMRIGWWEVLVRHIPHRIASTTARVDAASVAKRPCFLCSENMPREERGLALGGGFTAYANPFPILERHLTIVHEEHRPQRIAGMAAAALRIAEALPDSFLVYNGPECGASAPDHLHFQSCARALFPLGEETRSVEATSVPDYARRVLVLRDAERERLADRLERAVEVAADVTGKRSEPLLNLCFAFDAGRFTAWVFPRAKHRPRAFETGDLTVSPAAIDMAGVLVVPLPGDFERIGPEDVRGIYEEVTLGAEPFAALRRRVEELR